MAAEVFVYHRDDNYGTSISSQRISQEGLFSLEGYEDDEGAVTCVRVVEDEVHVFLDKVLSETPTEIDDEVDVELQIVKNIVRLHAGNKHKLRVLDNNQNEVLLLIKNVGDKAMYPILN